MGTRWERNMWGEYPHAMTFGGGLRGNHAALKEVEMFHEFHGSAADGAWGCECGALTVIRPGGGGLVLGQYETLAEAKAAFAGYNAGAYMAMHS